MVLRVVNTIHLEGVDFGPHLLQGLDVEVVSALGRSEEELVDCAAEATPGHPIRAAELHHHHLRRHHRRHQRVAPPLRRPRQAPRRS